MAEGQGARGEGVSLCTQLARGTLARRRPQRRRATALACAASLISTPSCRRRRQRRTQRTPSGCCHSRRHQARGAASPWPRSLAAAALHLTLPLPPRMLTHAGRKRGALSRPPNSLQQQQQQQQATWRGMVRSRSGWTVRTWTRTRMRMWMLTGRQTWRTVSEQQQEEQERRRWRGRPAWSLTHPGACLPAAAVVWCRDAAAGGRAGRRGYAGIC